MGRMSGSVGTISHKWATSCDVSEKLLIHHQVSCKGRMLAEGWANMAGSKR